MVKIPGAANAARAGSIPGRRTKNPPCWGEKIKKEIKIRTRTLWKEVTEDRSNFREEHRIIET